MDRVSVALGAILFLGSCASALKPPAELELRPEDLNQKIEALPPSVMAETVSDAPAPAAAADSAMTAPDTNAVVDKSEKSGKRASSGATKLPLKKGVEPASGATSGAAAGKITGAVAGTGAHATGAPATPAAPAGLKRPTSKMPASLPTWQPKAWPFGVGEKVVFALRYGVIEAGIATMEVKDPALIDGEPVIHYEGRVKSTRLLDLFYKVDDKIETWVSQRYHLPIRQEIEQLETGRWGRRVVVFDHRKNKAKFYASTTLKSGKTNNERREDKITPGAQDIFGALYFYRFVDNNTHYTFPIHDRFRNWSNQLTFLGKKKIKVPAGTFETLHYKMFPRVSGQLAPKGDVEIWINDAPDRVMVRFSAHVKVGSVTGELKEHIPGRPWEIEVPQMQTSTTIKPK